MEHKLKIKSCSAVDSYNIKEESIFHYVIKKALALPFQNEGKGRVIDLESLLKAPKNGSYLQIMKEIMGEHKRRLLLGEPDYIELYLKHFPILN